MELSITLNMKDDEEYDVVVESNINYSVVEVLDKATDEVNFDKQHDRLYDYDDIASFVIVGSFPKKDVIEPSLRTFVVGDVVQPVPGRVVGINSLIEGKNYTITRIKEANFELAAHHQLLQLKNHDGWVSAYWFDSIAKLFHER